MRSSRRLPGDDAPDLAADPPARAVGAMIGA